MANRFDPATFPLPPGTLSVYRARPNTSAGFTRTIGRVTVGIATLGLSEAERALRKSDREYADALAKAELWHGRYQSCAKKRREKGKGAYPGNPGKLPFPRDCRDKHKEWKKWEARAAERASALRKKKEAEGTLTRSEELRLLEASARPSRQATREVQQALEEWETRPAGEKRTKRAPSKQDIEQATFDPEEAAATVSSGGMPLWLLAGGAFAILGGGYLATRPKP
jgi:hypothetical protein